MDRAFIRRHIDAAPFRAVRRLGTPLRKVGEVVYYPIPMVVFFGLFALFCLITGPNASGWWGWASAIFFFVGVGGLFGSLALQVNHPRPKRK